MSNTAFDSLVKAQNLRAAKDGLARWEQAKARGTDLEGNAATVEDFAFLDRMIAGSRAAVAAAEKMARAWWA